MSQVIDQLRCRVPRVALQKFLERAALESRLPGELRAAVRRVTWLLAHDDRVQVVVAGSPAGFIALLNYVARDVAKDVRRNQPCALAELGNVLTPAVSRFFHPPRAPERRTRQLPFDFE